MRKVPLQYVEPGMVLAKTIYDIDGQVLAEEGALLNEALLKTLSRLGVASVNVYDDKIGDFQVEDVISEDTRTSATKTIKDVFANLQLKSSVDGKIVKGTVNQILDDVLTNQKALVNLIDVRSFDTYIFSHSVNVCMLSVLTGVFLGFDKHDLRELGIGALLHDVGKTKLPKELFYKADKLTREEFMMVQMHTALGFEILTEYHDLSSDAAQVALQHHERIDGSGYPRGLKGKEIHKYSKIVAVADVFDALLADRPFRKAFLPHEAVKIIEDCSGKDFDPHIIKIFLENVAIYPLGSIVQLNTGEIGVVIDVNKGKQTKPVIRVLLDRERKKIKDFIEIDLSKSQSVAINKVLHEEEIKLIREKL